MLQLVYGDIAERSIKSDLMYKYNLYNIYGVPAGVFSLINAKFPTAIHTHEYSVLPDIIKPGGNHLYCIFGNSYINVMLIKDHKLQVIQHFYYQSAEDAVYYLLNICQVYDATTADVMVHLSGMIEKESILYREVYKYFLNIEFEKLPENFNYSDEIKKLPQHLFSHLFAIVSCV